MVPCSGTPRHSARSEFEIVVVVYTRRSEPDRNAGVWAVHGESHSPAMKGLTFEASRLSIEITERNKMVFNKAVSKIARTRFGEPRSAEARVGLSVLAPGL